MAILGRIRSNTAALITVIGLALFSFVLLTGTGDVFDWFERDQFNQSRIAVVNGIDMDKDQEDASICRELYLLSACDTPDIHPTGVQCVRKGGPESANTYDLGCKCRLYGVGSKNKKLVGKASGKEVLLPGEIKKDGTVEKVDKKMMAFYN